MAYRKEYMFKCLNCGTITRSDKDKAYVKCSNPNCHYNATPIRSDGIDSVDVSYYFKRKQEDSKQKL